MKALICALFILTIGSFLHIQPIFGSSMCLALFTHQLDVQLGETSFEIRLKSNEDIYIRGSLEFSDSLSFGVNTYQSKEGRSPYFFAGAWTQRMFDYFGPNVKSLIARWQVGSGDTNINMYNEALSKEGATKEWAAFQTWTGMQAKAAGFNRARPLYEFGRKGQYSTLEFEFYRDNRIQN